MDLRRAPHTAKANDDGDSVRATIRQRRRLGANAFRLLGYLQSAIDAVDLAGAVHVREQFAEALGLGRGGVDDRLCALIGSAGDTEASGRLVPAVAPVPFRAIRN